MESESTATGVKISEHWKLELTSESITFLITYSVRSCRSSLKGP